MTKNTEPPVLKSFRMGDLELRNRVVLAPLTRARADADRVPNELMATYYAQRAGAGLIVSEATSISPEGNGWVGAPGIYEDAHVDGWRRITSAVHARGTPIFLQLWHTGRASHSSFHDGALPVAPSAIAIQGEGVHTPNGKRPHETPRALRIDELPRLVKEYSNAARRARDAGFDGVEIHAANGYLLDEFLQSKSNHRTDAYGGSIPNRFRLIREVVEAASSVVGPGRVGIRLSPNGIFNDMGSPDFRETFTYAARELDAYGLAYLHVLDGLAFGFHELGEAMTADEFRAVFRAPIVGNCGYTFDTANEAVERGAADLIAFGRPFISNPDLVERFRNGWPLAEEAELSTWYSGGGAVGYTDWPTWAGSEHREVTS